MKNVYERIGRSGRVVHLTALGAACLLLAACANGNVTRSRLASGGGQSISAGAHPHPRAARTASRGGSAQRRASQARGKPSHKGTGYSAVGVASWYGADFNGRRTADGETFDMNSLTAAHPSLPLPCKVRVTNLANRRSLVVRVNDRGPYAGHRLIDVSAKTAKLLGFYGRGLAKVKVEYVGRAD